MPVSSSLLHDKRIYLDADRAAGELCKRKFSFFVKEFWDIIVPNELVWNWHLDVLCDEIQDIDERVFKRLPRLHDAIFNVPPGSSKTKILSILSTAWEFARMPEIKVFVGSYSDIAVIAIADEIRIVMKSEKYRRYFPNVYIRKDFDTKHEFKTSKNGHFYAFTVGGTLTSKHADILKIDDPLNPKQAVSEQMLQNAIFFFDKTLPTRKVDKDVTATMVTMQRLAIDDPSGHLLKQAAGPIKHICLPGELGKDAAVYPAELRKKYIGGLLDPVRLSRKALAELKVKLGTDGYNAQILQDPVPTGGVILKKDWFEIVDQPIPRTAIKKFQLDTAYTEDQANDPSAIVAYYKEGHDVYITNAESVWMEFPQLIKFLPSFCQNNGYTFQSMIRVEPKASGKSVVQQLKSETDLNIVECFAPKEDKTTRVNTISPKIEAGRVKLHRGSWNESFISQCCAFPKGRNDDELDCLVAIVTNELIHDEDEWSISRVN